MSIWIIAYLVMLHAALVALLLRRPKAMTHVERMRVILQHVSQTTPTGAPVFLGDSHFQRLAVTAVADGAVNFAIGSQTAAQLAEAIPEAVSRAGVVYLQIGTNDVLAGDVDALPERLRIIRDALPSVPLVWTGIPPLGGREQPVNEAIRRLCIERPNTTYVQPPVDLLPDGVHIAPRGYADWIERLRDSSPT